MTSPCSGELVLLIHRVLFSLALLNLLLPCAQAQTPARQRILFDDGWRFHLQPPALLTHPVSVTAWQSVPAPEGSRSKLPLAGSTPAAQMAHPIAIGADVFAGKPGFAWFSATLPPLAGPRRTLHFASVDDNATVYLNNKKLTYHTGWDEPFDVDLDDAWNAHGSNTVTVLVENTAGQGGISGPVVLGTAPVPASADPSRPAFQDKGWRTVHLPHDYVVEGKFDPHGNAGHGFRPALPAWYRKTFSLPAADKGKSVWLDFDGVYRDSKVWLNGTLLGEHPSGYTSFRYDISRAARFGGVNLLAVSVDPRKFEGWWYDGGGIYRHVWLNVADFLHIAPEGVAVTASLPEPGADGVVSPATVAVKTDVVYPSPFDVNGPDILLVQHVVDPQGRVVASSIVSLPGLKQERAQSFTVAHPLLWSLETPRLYHLHTEVRQGTRVIDSADTPFGIRTIRFDAATGLYLNGKHVKIQGTCNHQDFAGVGVGVPDNLEYWRVRKLKGMGSNAWRMSHNPPTPALLDACDKLGMLVMDENRHLGDTYRDHTPPGTPATDLHDLADMIRRDRNHPSIILWSLCNEEGLQGSAEGARIFTNMMRVVRKYDTSRPITCAMNGSWGQGISTAEDLQGVNYHPQGYNQFHLAHPNIPLYGSETSSAVGTRGIYATDPLRGYVNAYDTQPGGSWANTAEDAWQPIADRPSVAGGFVWTGFDYRGEPTPFAWPCVSSHFGIMDTCGFPKDAYYYYQAAWGGKPLVHVFPHWNWAGKEGQPIKVWVYGNCAHVSLTLNGRTLGTKDMPRNGHLEWQVPYAPGRLEARGDNGGATVASDAVQTTGAPAALRLAADDKTLTADGEEISPIAVSVVDAQGRVVPTASDLVTFHVSGAGEVAGVGNGDPSSHEADNGTQRRAFNGYCLALVRASDRPGAIRVTATAPGLAPAALTLKAVAR